MSDGLLETCFPERRDGWLLLAVVAVMWLSTPWLGVWEPWEADQANVADLIAQDQTWLQVRLPTGKADASRHVAELPFGYWPVLASTTVLGGTTEMALRLPGLALGLCVVLLLFGTTRKLYGRLPAWFTVLGLLTMPLFSYHARLALGAGVTTALITLSSLAFLRAVTEQKAGWWPWVAWFFAGAAGLCGGVPALAVPLLVGAAASWTRSLAEQDPAEAWRRTFPLAPLSITLVVVGLGWWRASVYMPEGAGLEQLLLWTDPLGGAGSAAKRPTFEGFVHQIGFGLFPLGALVPLAFADLLWHPEREDEPAVARFVPPALAAWFAAAFLGPALGAPYAHLALFTGAPVVALAVGVYLARALRSPPQPLLALAAVVMLALLDSNLKHETHFLADAMVGAKVDAFPPSLKHWWIARVLDMALLGLLIVYQGGAKSLLRPAAALVYPLAPPRVFSLARVVGAALPTAILFTVFRTAAESMLGGGVWVRMKPGARLFILGAIIFVVVYVALYVLWTLWAAVLAGRGPVELSRRVAVRIADFVGEVIEWRPLRGIAMVSILVWWGLFQNVWVASKLTDNFSQKGITEAYSDRADGTQELFKYKVNAKNSTFYTRELEALTAKRFTKLAKSDGRFFAIIPRDQLARVNGEFRKATTRTLPVVDDRSFRFLLVSNQLGQHDTDHNPITHALVDGVPGDAHRAATIFRERKGGKDVIKLVGWKLDPEKPSRGSPLRITVYWEVLADLRSDWKVFVHLDTAGDRIHGDHDPVAGLYPTSDWTKGDIIADEHRVVVKRTKNRGRYTFYVGLYRGSTRMKVHKGAKDNDNRARLGTFRLR